MNPRSEETMPAKKKSPDESEGLSFDGPLFIRSISLSGIFFLMIMFSLYFAAPLFIPITLAFLLSLVLTPVMRLLLSLHIPQTISAILVVSVMGSLSLAALYGLSGPAADWLEEAPQGLRELEWKLRDIQKPIQKINEAKEQVDDLANMKDSQSVRSEEVRGDSFSIVKMIVSGAPAMLFGISVTFVLLFFLLASGDSFLRKLVNVISRLEDKKRAVETARDIQQQLSHYLGIITVINIVLGCAVAAVLYFLDVPNPLLWGAMTAILNFIPYLGPVVNIVIMIIVGLLTFDNTLNMLLPPLAVFILTALEGQFLTPMIAGHRLKLSPVAIFLMLVVMGWLWGIIGALLAVPILATIKIVCEYLEPFRPVAEFLGPDLK